MVFSLILEQMANSLISQIENIINSSILSFNMKVAKKYNIDVTELNELWTSSCDTEQPSQQPSQQPVVKKTTPPQSPSQEKTCPYSFSRGPNAGTVCGTKIKGEGNYCSKHKQYENKEQKASPKKVLPLPKKVSSDDDIEDEEEQRVREELNKKKTEGFTEQQVKYMFWKSPELGENLSLHKQTGFVCNEKKLIVGKKTIDNKVIPLTDEDIKVAKSWNFNIKQNDTKVFKIVKPPVITNATQETKAQETKAQESKTQETKAQETKAQETKAQETKAQPKQEATPKKISSTVKKFVLPVAKLTTTKIEKANLVVKENVEKVKKPIVNNSLNEEAKNTKKTISTIIEQQKDIEEILGDLTKGEEDIEEESIRGSDDEEDSGDDIQEEDEIIEDDE